jgi:hypothetical protein
LVQDERSRSRRHQELLKGQYGAEFEPELQSVDMGGGRVDDRENGKRGGRIGREEVDEWQGVGDGELSYGKHQ